MEEETKNDLAKAQQQAETIGIDIYTSMPLEDQCEKLEEYGICRTCCSFRYARTEFEVKRAWCREIRMTLSSSEPITQCSMHDPKGGMSLDTMWKIATKIDPPKRKAGFISEEGGE